MWNTFAEFTLETLDVFGIWIGILAFIPIMWTWIDVSVGRRARQRRRWRRLRQHTGTQPAVLLLDLLVGKEARPSVARFAASHEALAELPAERFVVIKRKEWLRESDMLPLALEIRDAAAALLDAGADVIHYFHAGPTVPAALVGAELANQGLVILYQHDSRTGEFHNFGPLRPVAEK